MASLAMSLVLNLENSLARYYSQVGKKLCYDRKQKHKQLNKAGLNMLDIHTTNKMFFSCSFFFEPSNLLHDHL